MEEIDLKELIGMFLEQKFLIIFIVVLSAVLGAIYTIYFITPMYDSSTSLVLVQTGDMTDTSLKLSESITTTDITLNSKLVDAYAVVAKSKRVTNKVISNLKLDMSTNDLIKSITVFPSSDTQNLRVSVKHENPEEACRIANEIAKVFIEEATEIYKVKNLYILDSAEINTIPCNINIVKNIVIFTFIGTALVAGYILLINMLDTTLKTDIDIERTVALPVLASIILVDENNKRKTKNNKRKTKNNKRKTKNNTSKKVSMPRNMNSYNSTMQYYNENKLKDNKNSANLVFSTNKNNLENQADQFSNNTPKKRNIRNIKKGGI